jgi:hypothetical protein
MAILRADHFRSTAEVEALHPGSTLPFVGGTTRVLALGPVHAGTVGSYAWRVVLHCFGEIGGEPFAVHTVHYDDETDHEPWRFNNGDYRRALADACDAFNDRVPGADKLRVR